MLVSIRLKMEVTGHFEHVVNTANLYWATCISIQDHYTFCNFERRWDALAFVRAMDMKEEDINTERPGVLYEVAVPHPR